MIHTDKKALVVLSGGQDSVTCLGVALKQYGNVEAICFEYGQRHTIELEQAEQVCRMFNVNLVEHTIPSLETLADSALIGGKGDVSDKHHDHKDLPASFVPNRNALFITIAHAYAQKIKADHLILGVCETDYSGYPDCRAAFIDAMEETLNLGYQTAIRIRTPLMYIDKAATFQLAEDVDFLNVVLEHSHTCYNGIRNTKHEWGYGCAQCPACELRAKGYDAYLANRKQTA